MINLASKYFAEIKTLEQLKISQMEQSILKITNEIAASNISLEEKIQQIINKIAEIIDIDACSFYLRDPYSGELSLQAATDISPSFFGVLKLKRQSGGIAKAIKQKRAIILKEHPEYFFDEDQEDQEAETESYQFILPLVADEEVLGVVIFIFSGSLIKSNKLLSICQNISQILSRTTKTELERDRKALQAIRMTSANEAGMSLISILDQEKLGFTICASCCQLVDGEISMLRLYQASENSLLVFSNYSSQQSSIDKPVHRLDAQIALETFSRGKSQLLINLTKTKYADIVPGAINSCISFPLTQENKILGTLSVYNKLEKSSFSSSYFNKDDEEALERLAFYSSMALKNAQDFDQRKSLFTINELTGLYNIKSFEYRLMEEISRSSRHREKFSILIAKIENLKDIKVNFGISKNFVIKLVAALLEEHFRKSDIIFHLADDKFAVLLVKPEATKSDDKSDGISRFKTFIAQKSLKIRGLTAPLKLSLGNSAYPDDASSPEQLINKASLYGDSVSFGESLSEVKAINIKESELDDLLASS